MNRMWSQSFNPVRRRRSFFRGSFPALFFLLVLVRAGLLFAADALQMVPGDVAGVVVFRNVTATSEKLTQFVRRLHPGYDGFDFSAVSEEMLGLAPGTMDASKPIVVIVSKPEGLHNFLKRSGLNEKAASYPVIAFTPKQPAKLLKELRNRENRARRMEGPHGNYYLLMRDGIAFVSPTRKALRILRNVGPESSIAATMGKEAMSICKRSDVFLHLPLARWREKISPYVWMVSSLIKLGITAQQDPAEQETTMALVNWFVDGARDAVDQMQTVTLALDFDGETFGLSHRFAFDRRGGFAEYISQVRRSGLDLWKPLPDRPFVVLGVFDWQCPPATSLICRLNRYFWNTEYARKAVSDRKRQKLLACAESCYGGMKGTQFIVTPPPDGTHPVQVYGGYAADDPSGSFEQYCYIQKNSQKALAALIPGGAGFTGDFKKRHREDVTYFELEFNLENVPEAMRRSMVGVYGEGVRVQYAVVGKHEVVYSIAQPPWGVLDQIKAMKTGRNAGMNPAVIRIRRLLPAESQAIVILDIRRLIGLVPHLALGMDPERSAELGESRRKAREAVRRRAQEGEAEKEASQMNPSRQAATTSGTLPSNHQPGPLLGWSCLARDNALDCRLVIKADDLLEAARLARALAADPLGSRAETKKTP